MAPVRFALPTVIDPSASAFEPAVAVNALGNVVVCSLRGVGRGSDVWSSGDGGRTFDWRGQPTARSVFPIRLTPGDLGGGDCDLGADRDGRFYLADLWLGSVSVSASEDGGATWSGTPASVLAPPVDRPWVVGGEGGEAFVTAAQLATTGYEQQGLSSPPPGGIWVARTTDGGRTFPQQARATDNEGRIELNGNIARSPDGALYLAFVQKVAKGVLALDVARSTDNGVTWDVVRAAQQSFPPGACSPLKIFPVMATDDAHGVFLAWVLDNPDTGRYDLFFVASPDAGATWRTPFLVTSRDGTRLYPSIVGGSAGRAALAWYEANETLKDAFTTDPPRLQCDWTDAAGDAAWYVRYAVTSNATADSPSFVEGLVQEEPFTRGSIARPYAERFGIAAFPDGSAAVVYPADVAEGPARPVFARQSEGPRLR